MFSASFKDTKHFKHIIESLKDLVSEACFTFSKTGITCQTIDSSHTSYLAVKLDADTHFSEYTCSDEPVVIGISITSLVKVLKCADASFNLKLKYSDNNNQGSADVLTLALSDETRKLDFQLKLMDIDSDALEIPDQYYDCTIKLLSTEFLKVMRDLNSLGDICTIKCGNKSNTVKFSTVGEVGKAEIEMQCIDYKTSDTIIKLDFSIRYLVMFASAYSISKFVTIHLTEDAPVLLDYTDIKFFLAPKISEDD